MRVINYAVLTGSLTVYSTVSTATTIAIGWTLSMESDMIIRNFEFTYSYTVRRCLSPPGASRTDSISNGTMRSHTLSGLNEDSDYTITVRAFSEYEISMGTIIATTHTSGNHMIVVIINNNHFVH